VGQPERFDRAESVAARSRRPSADRLREQVTAELDGEHGPGLTHTESVDHDGEPRTVPQVQEVEGGGHRGQHCCAVRIEPHLL